MRVKKGRNNPNAHQQVAGTNELGASHMQQHDESQPHIHTCQFKNESESSVSPLVKPQKHTKIQQGIV